MNEKNKYSSARISRTIAMQMVLCGTLLWVIVFAIVLRFDLESPEMHGAHWIAKGCIFAGVFAMSLGLLRLAREWLQQWRT
jgi:hypothetical protein